MLLTFWPLLFGWSLFSADLPALELMANDVAQLKNADLKSDGPSLLAFFQRRTLPDEERTKVKALIAQLGSKVYREREQAMAELARRGPVVAELLRDAVKNDDLETSRRAEKILARIQEKDVPVDVLPAAVRLLAKRRPPGAVEGMLAYMPFADNDAVADEVRVLLARLAQDGGKVQPALKAALTDKLAVRRAAAAEALCHIPGERQAVSKVLADPDAYVRLRVALALIQARDRGAVQALIDTLPHLTLHQAWQAEEVLFRLAEDRSPPAVALGHDEAGRKNARDVWSAWWRDHAKSVDLATLDHKPKVLGYTMVILLDMGRVMELGPKNQVRWQVDNLMLPLDVQYLPGDRILVAEYQGGRATERNLKGEVLWEKEFANVQVAHRLSNGNTFLSSDTEILEVDRNGKAVYSFTMPGGERIMKSAKLQNGEIVCLTDAARLVRFNTAGKELFSFNVPIANRLFGGRLHVLPSGRILIPHNSENKVVEYDARGKPVWEISIDQPVVAYRLPNGNTMVTTILPARGAVELNRLGQEVWSYRANTRVTRAIRR